MISRIVYRNETNRMLEDHGLEVIVEDILTYVTHERLTEVVEAKTPKYGPPQEYEPISKDRQDVIDDLRIAGR